jgi:DNA-binding CsgD family transcriptional regulator
MNSKLQELNQKYMNLLQSIPFVEKDLDYGILNKHRPYLEQLDTLGKSAVSVFDLFRKTHVYISPSYKEKLNLPEHVNEGPEGFDRLMHPDDLLFISEAGYHFMRMAITRFNGSLQKFKLVNDFRIRRDEQTWMRMTEQHRILETDIHGNFWLALSVVDISPEQNPNLPARSRLIHLESGDVQAFPPEGSTPLPDLSSRELQVLSFISKGMVSKQIADELHISIHTVNTHRQNIIEKMNVTNTAEAIQVAGEHGFFLTHKR